MLWRCCSRCVGQLDLRFQSLNYIFRVVGIGPVNQRVGNFVVRAMPLLRPIAQAMVGRLPAPSSRLTGALARDGGRPVRDVRLRPWASASDGNLVRWHTVMRAALRQIFLRGVEGLPQPLAEQFAQQWAVYCGCQYGLLLTNGTDALRVGLAAALDHDGLRYGGEVIVPNFSYIATATAPLDRRFGLCSSMLTERRCCSTQNEWKRPSFPARHVPSCRFTCLDSQQI